MASPPGGRDGTDGHGGGGGTGTNNCVCVCVPISPPPRGLAEVLRSVCSPKLQSPSRSLPPSPPCINIRSENETEASTLSSEADLHGAARRPFQLFDT